MPAGLDPLTPLIPYVLLLNVALAALVVVLVLRLRTVARRMASAGADPTVMERLESVGRELAVVSRRLDHLAGRTEKLAEQAARALQRVGLVRYDAFKDMGGHLSFTVALLDARRDGIVLSVLNDRDGARAYAKPVRAGRSTFALSEEEQRAIAEA
ncbi:MAG: DUF4446 family protein [Armatimonadota bacterium]|nr:DUF4446 family protein [Armatimonadota bacterium]MDR7551137.1 DUF4446 family protein [Armatimonadota bacterium]